MFAAFGSEFGETFFYFSLSFISKSDEKICLQVLRLSCFTLLLLWDFLNRNGASLVNSCKAKNFIAQL